MSIDNNSSLYCKIKNDAESGGYFLNPDTEFVMELIDGLNKNKDRYGYISCPCRLASGFKAEDLDIICPCDYRDIDLYDYNACYCALYVSKDAYEGKAAIRPIPERRPRPANTAINISANADAVDAVVVSNHTANAVNNVAEVNTYPVWRCKVCGYLCSREHPPGICPICKASAERFELFRFS